MAKHKVKNNREQERYEMEVGDDLAVIEYDLPKQRVIVLTHTFVPEHLEGQGIGSELVEAVLDDIREQGWNVVPQCGFVAQYIRRHPQWEELIYTGVSVD